jgi:hypothetical protein
VYSGTADLTTILQEEAEGKYIKRVQEETGELFRTIHNLAYS